MCPLMKESAVNFNIEWSGFSEYCTSLMSREENIEFCDVTLVCDDGAKLNAHQIFLVTSSSVLKSILSNNKHPNPTVYLSGVQMKDMSSLLDFIYKGETSLQQDNLQNFLDLADNLRIKGLNNKTTPNNSEKYNSTSLSNTRSEKEGINIDQDLFTIVSKSDKKLAVQMIEVKEFKMTKNTSDTFGNSRETTENLQALYKKEEHDKMQILDNTMSKYIKNTIDPLENPHFSCSRDETDVAMQILSMIERHDKSEKPGKHKHKYRCNVCNRVSRDKSDCMRHVEKHINGLIYSCLVCSHTTSTKSGIKAHILIHTRFHTSLSEGKELFGEEIELFSCSLDKTFVETEALSMIEKQEGDGTKGVRKYKCNVCQKVSKDKSDGMRHAEIHINGLMYSCMMCAFKSVSRQSINTHILRHEGISQRNSSETKNSTYLVNMDKDKLEEQVASMMEKREHQIDGKKGNKWSCNVCSKISNEKSQCVAHVESHISGLTYSCPHCNYQEFNRNAITRHMYTIHPGFSTMQ